MGRHVARPFQRFPLFSRSLNALHTSRGSYLRTFESPRVLDLVSIRGQFPNGSLEWKPIEVRNSRAVSQPSLVESGPGTATRPIARRWKMSGCDPIRCPEDLCVCAATVRGGRNRKRRERERERGTTRSEVYRRTNLCRCHANVIRIRSLSTRVHAGFDLSSKRIRQRIPLSIERFLSNFYTQ